MNKDLYNSKEGVIKLPDNIKSNLVKNFNRVVNSIDDLDKHIEGYRRNTELQKQEFIDYKQLKRIKNFFDSFKGSQKHPSFILNGGTEMKNWVNDELRKMREFGKMTSRNKMNTGMQNSFIDPHEKKDFTNVRPSQEHSKTVDKYNAAVTESLIRIKEIISKI